MPPPPPPENLILIAKPDIYIYIYIYVYIYIYIYVCDVIHARLEVLAVCVFLCGDQGVGFNSSGLRFRVSALPVLLCNPKPRHPKPG